MNALESRSPSTGLWRWVELSRVHKFAGSMLVFWPCAWGMTMAARPLSLSLQTYGFNLTYGLVAAALLHSMSAACVWNDILDRDIDRQVERTKHRPIADGRVSVPGALVFLAIHLVILLALLQPCNALAWNFGLTTIFPLAGIYPLLKRVTYWPQVWLGVAVNMISLVAWSALQSQLTLASGVLFLGCCWWSIYYDTIYACQDRRDDVKAGVKSTALLFGRHVKKFLAVFAGIMVACLTSAGVLNGQGIPYFTVAVGGTAYYFVSQLQNLDVDDPNGCLSAFESNAFYLGRVIWAGIFIDYLFG
ncbi:UbiA prenyltransferase family [Lactifluus volemus]|nr:UbiA prenyltransferase family [Lactifluus volemus]